MSDDTNEQQHHEIVIVRRHGDHEEGHHGGAWKIAFADFMTAMMAFFLVLWIVNSSSKETKTALANYFNPMKIVESSPGSKGIHEPNQASPGASGQGPTGLKGASSTVDGEKNGGAAKKDAHDTKTEALGTMSRNGGPEKDSKPGSKPPSMSDAELFADPYDALAKIAGPAGTSELPPGARSEGPVSSPGDWAVNDDTFRDPFKPLARAASAARSEGTPSTQADAGAKSKDIVVAAADPKPDAAPTPSAKPAATARSAAAPLVAPSAAPQVNAAQAKAEAEAKDLQAAIAQIVKTETGTAPGPKLDVQATDEGVLISLTDQLNFGMFSVGSAEPQAKLVHIMEDVAALLKTRPGAIVVRGHTDARPYRRAGYDNWRLSADRAQMAHYMLVRGGLDEKRIDRIEGYADRRPKTGDPMAPENRRIEILLRKDKS